MVGPTSWKQRYTRRLVASDVLVVSVAIASTGVLRAAVDTPLLDTRSSLLTATVVSVLLGVLWLGLLSAYGTRDLRVLGAPAPGRSAASRTPRCGCSAASLCKFSLDELPQLVNVLRGEMSIVGHRPPLRREVETYTAEVHRRLLVRPGMTGLWQVSGRSDLSWDESVRLDLSYVENWSMTADVSIMARTLKAVLASNGAY